MSVLDLWAKSPHAVPHALSFGPIRWTVSDDRFRRIHHFIEKVHWNRNFGGDAVMLRDMMF